MSFGPTSDAVSAIIPGGSTGPLSDSLTGALPGATYGPVYDEEAAPVGPSSFGPVYDDVADLLIGYPTIDAFSAEQRDTRATFLVDLSLTVSFVAVPPQTDVLNRTVEWRRGTTAAWNAATAQSYDYRHTAVDPLPGFPANGLTFGFVWNAFFDLPEGQFDDVYLRLTVTNNPSDEAIIGPLTVVTKLPLTDEEAQAQSFARRAGLDQLLQERNAFLGCGLIIPFRRASRDFANACDVELIRSTVRQILGTRAAVRSLPGDLKWRPDFGSKLWVLRHRNNDYLLREEATTYVQEALEWEPRVRVTEVIPTVDAENPNRLKIRVRYKIIDENVPENRVILPEFEEVITI